MPRPDAVPTRIAERIRQLTQPPEAQKRRRIGFL